ncbi:MAG: extracellular solute-binding protein [Anaerolineae bacterium]|nr:extracellular solute-binding protein [Anaerolineae bacterium]
MRKVSLVLLLLVLALSVGLVSAQDMANIDPSGQTVVYWHQYNSGPQFDTMNAFIETFNSTNEWGITVEPLPQGNYNDIRDLMNANIISGDLPNLVAGYTNDALNYAADGVVVDLNAYYNDPTWGFSDEDKADLNEGVLNIGVQEGQRVGWPNQTSAEVLVVNMTMLKELGFDAAPTTLDEFKAIACAAAQLEGPNGEDIQGYPIKGDASEFESYVASQGGAIFHDGAWDFTGEASVAILQMYQDLYNEGCAYLPDSAFGNTDDFALGLNPMAITSTAGVPFIIKGMEAAGISPEWVVTLTPWSEGNRTIQVFAPSIIMLNSTPEAQLASWLFLKFLAQPENQQTWTQNTSYFSSRYSVQPLLADYLTQNPYFAEGYALLNDPEINVYSGFQRVSYGGVRGLVSTAIADVTANGRPVADVAQELTDAANALETGG